MPGMGGKEVYDRLKEIDSAVRVIFISGHRSDSIKDLSGQFAFIRKPFALATLSQEICRAQAR